MRQFARLTLSAPMASAFLDRSRQGRSSRHIPQRYFPRDPEWSSSRLNCGVDLLNESEAYAPSMKARCFGVTWRPEGQSKLK